VVVPDLQLRRRQVARVFKRVLGAPAAFNLSIGEPLSDYPVVSFALSLLEFSAREIDFETASRLIRSPFIGGAETEMAARARFDARLRDESDSTVSLPKLISLVNACPDLRSRLEKVYETKNEKHSPDGQHFTAVWLQPARARRADSASFRRRRNSTKCLDDFSASRWFRRFFFQTSIQELRACARDLFQPEGAQ
jgi:hypothetical protein